MATWTNGVNEDGLLHKFGTNQGRSITDGGAYNEFGMTESVVLEINLKDLTETEAIQNDVLVLPKGAKLVKFELDVVESAATGVAIDVGTIHVSRDAADSAYTADPDGILAAVVTAELVAGYHYEGWAPSGEFPAFGSTGAFGDDLGIELAVPMLITASRTTSTAFTAGKIRLRVHFLANAEASNQFALG